MKSLVYHADKQKITPHNHAHTMHIHTEISQPLIVNTEPTVLVTPDPDCLEMEEKQCVQSYVSGGCGCELWKGKPCRQQFSMDHFLEFRGQCKELTKADLDMGVLGELSAFMFSGEQTVRVTNQRHVSGGRQHLQPLLVWWGNC